MNSFDSLVNAGLMLELHKKIFSSILDGKCHQAREAQKKLAKLAISDFEAYKALPSINFRNAPFRAVLMFAGKVMKFRIFKAFTRKTPEEKQLAEKCKEYAKELTPEAKKTKTIDVDFPYWC